MRKRQQRTVEASNPVRIESRVSVVQVGVQRSGCVSFLEMI